MYRCLRRQFRPENAKMQICMALQWPCTAQVSVSALAVKGTGMPALCAIEVYRHIRSSVSDGKYFGILQNFCEAAIVEASS